MLIPKNTIIFDDNDGSVERVPNSIIISIDVDAEKSSEPENLLSHMTVLIFSRSSVKPQRPLSCSFGAGKHFL